MLFYSIILILTTLLYISALLRLRKSFKNLKAGENKRQPAVSVIVAARNEEGIIGKCLSSLLDQTYPKNKLEIIVIDDRSEDETVTVVQKLAATKSQIKLFQIKNRSTDLAPKKHAIDLGIQNAAGEIIVTTDADCQPKPEWIAELIKYFEPEVGMVAGYNPYKARKPSLFYQTLSLDYFAMACVAAASAGLDYPLSCTGGNLAYRKKVYQEMGGFNKFSNWVSGDDDLFLEQIRENSNWKIQFTTNPKSFVPTAPPETLKDFVQQRIRYASKGRHYSPKVTLGLVGVYLMNLLISIGPILAVFKPQILPVWLTSWSLKTLSEFFFLKSGEREFQTRFKTALFLFVAVVHPLYIVLAGLLGQFFSFRWKGERYSGKMTKPKLIEETV